MSQLGRGGPFHRAAAILRGLVRPRMPPAPTGRPCRVIGHRGAARLEAENTIASFRRALELGADTIETDVSVTADGRFALWHDADPDERVALARQLGAEKLAYKPMVPSVGSEWRRPVRELSSDDLVRHYAYEACEPSASAPRVGIAWLEDLEEWISKTGVADVYIDIKLADDQTEAAAGLVRRLSRARGGTIFHLLSPRNEIVRALADACRETGSDRLRPSADLELPAPPIPWLRRTGAPDVSLGLGGRLWPAYRYDVGQMLRAREAGAFGAVVAWTHNDPEHLRTLVAAGIDGVLTDEAALLRRLVSSAGRALRRG